MTQKDLYITHDFTSDTIEVDSPDFPAIEGANFIRLTRLTAASSKMALGSARDKHKYGANFVRDVAQWLARVAFLNLGEEETGRVEIPNVLADAVPILTDVALTTRSKLFTLPTVLTVEPIADLPEGEKQSAMAITPLVMVYDSTIDPAKPEMDFVIVLEAVTKNGVRYAFLNDFDAASEPATVFRAANPATTMFGRATLVLSKEYGVNIEFDTMKDDTAALYDNLIPDEPKVEVRIEASTDQTTTGLGHRYAELRADIQVPPFESSGVANGPATVPGTKPEEKDDLGLPLMNHLPSVMKTMMRSAEQAVKVAEDAMANFRAPHNTQLYFGDNISNEEAQRFISVFSTALVCCAQHEQALEVAFADMERVATSHKLNLAFYMAEMPGFVRNYGAVIQASEGIIMSLRAI